MKFLMAILFLSSFFINTHALAQRTKPAVKPTKPVAYKVPKLTVTLGTYKDASTFSPQTSETVIAMPLKIIDDKNVPYTLLSYQFAYKKVVTTEDENTGKSSKTTALKAGFFKVTPLPQNWVDLVREYPQPGEEWLFFAITVKDAQGRVMYAPDLKLLIK
ncbi:hypothetical protein ACFOWM_02450 [Ferruginibacter yonginensis]|uniref:Uncharacterized protein n=1 Tax=Ferruginibacter yonginensis TaxID=1310416 RepID=A0ABV8QN60_9BACT